MDIFVDGQKTHFAALWIHDHTGAIKQARHCGLMYDTGGYVQARKYTFRWLRQSRYKDGRVGSCRAEMICFCMLVTEYGELRLILPGERHLAALQGCIFAMSTIESWTLREWARCLTAKVGRSGCCSAISRCQVSWVRFVGGYGPISRRSQGRRGCGCVSAGHSPIRRNTLVGQGSRGLFRLHIPRPSTRSAQLRMCRALRPELIHVARSRPRSIVPKDEAACQRASW